MTIDFFFKMESGALIALTDEQTRTFVRGGGCLAVLLYSTDGRTPEDVSNLSAPARRALEVLLGV